MERSKERTEEVYQVGTGCAVRGKRYGVEGTGCWVLANYQLPIANCFLCIDYRSSPDFGLRTSDFTLNLKLLLHCRYLDVIKACLTELIRIGDLGFVLAVNNKCLFYRFFILTIKKSDEFPVIGMTAK